MGGKRSHSSRPPQRARSPSPAPELSPQTSAPASQRVPLARPQLARNASDTALSSNSIMTLSKMYKEQQQRSTSPPAIPTKSPPLRGLSALSPSSKKLHKRVLSSTSVKDYFAAAKDDDNSATTSTPGSAPSAHATSPGPRLPTFQRIEQPSSSSLPQPQLQRPGLTQKSLSSSKIYERRMKQLNEDADKSIEHDIFSGADITDEQLQDTEEIDRLNQHKRAEFFGSDAESDDVDIHSDDGQSSPDKFNDGNNNNNRTKTKSESHQEHDDVSSSASSHAEEKKYSVKNLFRRMTSTDSRPTNQDITSVTSESKGRNFFTRMALGEEDEFDNLPEDNIFAKIINMSGGGGMAPGASKSENQKQDDEEAQLHALDDIPMQNFDPEAQAQDILQAHRHHYPASVASSNEATLKDANDSFLAPNPDFYFRQNDSDLYDINVDAGDETYVAPPERVRGGVLSSLLKLYENPTEASRSRLTFDGSDGISPINSAVTTPIMEEDNPYEKTGFGKKIKNFATGKKKVHIDDSKNEQHSMLHAHKRVASMTDLASITDHLTPDFISKKKQGSNPHLPSFTKAGKPHNIPRRPKLMKGASGLIKAKREAARAKITVHIADLLQRQGFILKMCKGLMLYGAPTHRLEEYLRMTARVLEIDGQFVYLPGVMIVSFGDPTTRTSEVQIVRSAQGIDLYKLHRIHRIYKQVIHDLIGVDEASTSLDDLFASKQTFGPWVCVLIYGLSSLSVTPWAYGGGWINLPVTFGIGLLVGFLQFIVSPKSNLYSNVFEVAASIVVSFIARGLGSISGANICFSACAQGSLAMILPGWMILSGSLELQSRNIVAGSVRMFYAVIYSLMLGYGITLGAVLYGWIDNNATDATTCTESISNWWRFLFVPMFTIGLATINQARLFQIPVMLFISCSGHVVSFFASKHFYNSTEFTSAIACFVIGILGNLYSRIFKGIAVSAMLPGVFLQIPGGMAAQNSLLSGIQTANQIVDNTTTTSTTDQALSGLAVGFSLIQVCVGITVGLFASTIVVYPFGKKSTSVFTL